MRYSLIRLSAWYDHQDVLHCTSHIIDRSDNLVELCQRRDALNSAITDDDYEQSYQVYDPESRSYINYSPEFGPYPEPGNNVGGTTDIDPF